MSDASIASNSINAHNEEEHSTARTDHDYDGDYEEPHVDDEYHRSLILQVKWSQGRVHLWIATS
jgi:hypothetical protein